MLHHIKTKLKPLSFIVMGLTLSVPNYTLSQEIVSSFEPMAQINQNQLSDNLSSDSNIYKTSNLVYTQNSNIKYTQSNQNNITDYQTIYYGENINPLETKISDNLESSLNTTKLTASTTLANTQVDPRLTDPLLANNQIEENDTSSLSSINPIEKPDALNLPIVQETKESAPEQINQISEDESNIKTTKADSLGVLSASLKSKDSQSQEQKTENNYGKVAIIYFSQPEKVHSNRIDELTAASLVICRQNNSHGLLQYVAMIIRQQLQEQATLVHLEPLVPYSQEHDDLIDQASLEIDTKARPRYTLNPHINLDEYDTIFIGYPIWWYDLPMIFYTFLEHEDLSGKTIIPFCSHGGSQAFNTVKKLQELEPNANVLTQVLSQNRIEIFFSGRDNVRDWLQGLGFKLKDVSNTTVDGCKEEKEELSVQSLEIESNPNLGVDIIKD